MPNFDFSKPFLH